VDWSEHKYISYRKTGFQDISVFMQ